MIIKDKTQIKKFMVGSFVTCSELWLKKDDVFDFPHFIISNDKWWDGGFDSLCSVEEKRDFYEIASQAFNIIKKFAQTCGETKCCVGPFHMLKNFADWSNLDEFDSYNALKSQIGRKQHLILDMAEDANLISLIVENNFRYFSEIGLYFKNADVLIEPTHNSELIVFSENIEKHKLIFSDIIKDTGWYQ